MTKDWCILLAAGKSKRFGGPKAMAEWQGRSLISRAVETAQAGFGENVLIVWGAYEFSQIQGVHKVFNEKWRQGMGASLSCALRRLDHNHYDPKGVLVMTVDQPRIAPSHCKALADKGREEGLSVLTSNGKIDGPPAFLLRKDYMKLLNLKDDRGAKAYLDKYASIEVGSGVFMDIDTPDDLKKL